MIHQRDGVLHQRDSVACYYCILATAAAAKEACYRIAAVDQFLVPSINFTNLLLISLLQVLEIPHYVMAPKRRFCCFSIIPLIHQGTQVTPSVTYIHI